MTITWRDVPDEIQAALAPMLAKWLPVAPSWLERIGVSYTDTDDASLSTTVHPEYRQMALYVHPAWLLGDQEKRESDVLHELLHAPLEQARDVFHDLLRTQVDDTDPLFEWAKNEYRKALESAVCDLEYGVQRLLAQPHQE